MLPAGIVLYHHFLENKIKSACFFLFENFSQKSQKKLSYQKEKYISHHIHNIVKGSQEIKNNHF